MKRAILKVLLVAQLIVMPLFLAGVFADPPGPPGPGGDPGSSGGVPVGAPIDNGVVILIGLGLVYGCYKLDVIRRKKITQKEEEQIQSARNFEL
jgi:hypothetical protein